MPDIISMIPVEYWPYAAAAVTLASIAVKFMPIPSGNNSFYTGIYNLLRLASINNRFKVVRNDK